MKARRIVEAKDLMLYKKMLRVFGDYTADVPFSGASQLFDNLVENGAKVLPSDATALGILNHVLNTGSNAASIHKLLNIRFSDLPGNVRPMIRPGRKLIVANWSDGNQVSDRVKDLVNWNGKGKSGFWSDINGEKSEVVDLTIVEK